jgi:hypothetical protein
MEICGVERDHFGNIYIGGSIIVKWALKDILSNSGWISVLSPLEHLMNYKVQGIS